jgi:hypothetical protein
VACYIVALTSKQRVYKLSTLLSDYFTSDSPPTYFNSLTVKASPDNTKTIKYGDENLSGLRYGDILGAGDSKKWVRTDYGGGWVSTGDKYFLCEEADGQLLLVEVN